MEVCEVATSLGMLRSASAVALFWRKADWGLANGLVRGDAPVAVSVCLQMLFCIRELLAGFMWIGPVHGKAPQGHLPSCHVSNFRISWSRWCVLLLSGDDWPFLGSGSVTEVRCPGHSLLLVPTAIPGAFTCTLHRDQFLGHSGWMVQRAAPHRKVRACPAMPWSVIWLSWGCSRATPAW